MEDPIIIAGGRELLGQAVYESREIQLSPTLHPAQRLDVLLHELYHCWEFHVPQPRTDEERASLHAMVSASAMADMDAQGGEATLRKMTPPRFIPEESPDVEPVDDAAIQAEPRYVMATQLEDWQATTLASAGRAQCKRCDTIIADGSIVSSEPRWDFIACGNVCDRVLYCPHCHHLQKWVEGCTANGTPNGSVAEVPVLVVGAAVDAYLAEHPEAVGMMC